MSKKPYQQWSVDDVSNWLVTIHLSNLVPVFERHDISGVTLPYVDETFMKDRLRMAKPAEVASLKGALAHLLESAEAQPQYPHRKPIPRPPPQAQKATRPGEGGVMKSPPVPMRQKSSTMPNKKNFFVPTAEVQLREPQLVIAPAQDLLDDHCKHSGWIKKQGGSHKSWKRRYLILRLGCLYYYTNETGTRPKGQFTLSGYQLELCKDPKITAKHKWTLQLTPPSLNMRSYYFAWGARKEMESWKQEIEEEITLLPSKKNYGSGTTTLQSPTPSSPTSVNENTINFSSEEEEEEATYDEVIDDDQEIDDSKTPIYDDIDGDDGDGSDGYRLSTVSGMLLPPPRTSPVGQPRSSPINLPLDDKPVVAQRSLISLGLNHSNESPSVTLQSHHHKPPPPAPQPKPRRKSEVPSLPEEPESTYLSLVSCTSSPPSSSLAGRGDASAAVVNSTNTITREGHTITLPNKDDGDYVVQDEDESPDNYIPEPDPDAYYIMVRRVEELYPGSCVFGQIGREEVDRLLRSKSRDGTYLIREGTHAGTAKVMSVWQIDRVRHYKLFEDESGFSLTQGQSFKTIPELLQFYHMQCMLPKSDFYLGDPYHPSDH